MVLRTRVFVSLFSFSLKLITFLHYLNALAIYKIYKYIRFNISYAMYSLPFFRQSQEMETKQQSSKEKKMVKKWCSS